MKLLRDLLDDFIDYRRGLRFSPDYLYALRRRATLFLDWLEPVHMVTTPDRIRTEHLEGYTKSLSTQCTCKGLPLKPASLNNKLYAVGALLKYLHAHGFTVRDLSAAIEPLKMPSMLPTSVLNHRKVKKMLRKIDITTSAGYMERTIIEVLYSCGIRAGELLRLRVGDVDADAGLLRVLGKGRKERMVPIGRTASRYLRTYLVAIRSLMPGSHQYDSLFLHRGGKPYTRVPLRNMIHKHAAAAGLDAEKVTPHTFRRTCTTELVRSNANLYHIKELLGHESLSTLKPYTKLTILDLQKTHAKCHPRELDEKRERG